MKLRSASALMPVVLLWSASCTTTSRIAPVAPDISGNWELSMTADWTRIPSLVCTLVQTGPDLRGDCRPAADPLSPSAKLSAGKVDDEKVSCEWTVVTPDGDRWTYALTGTVDPTITSMRGSFKLSNRFGGGEGRFTAKRL